LPADGDVKSHTFETRAHSNEEQWAGRGRHMPTSESVEHEWVYSDEVQHHCFQSISGYALSRRTVARAGFIYDYQHEAPAG
jgi:hypothetical protein